MGNVNEIKTYWEDFWNKRKISGSQNDTFFQEISSDAIFYVLPECDMLLIVGCGDGTGIKKYTKKAKTVVGLDFSEIAIKKARPLFPNVEFVIGDILQKQFANNGFDVIISERCICNLKTPEEQILALAQLYKCLKTDGILILCEPWLQGYDRIDEIRKSMNLKPLKRHWHNVLLDQVIVEKSQFHILEINTFGIYSIISRIFHPAFVQPKEPQFDDNINRLGALINNAVMFNDGFNNLPSQHILYILKKR